MSVLKVKNGNQWDIVPAIKGDPGDPAADESITDDMLVTDGIKTEIEWLWGNQLTKELTGEVLTAADAYAAPPMALTVEGKSTQATTTGKNLIPNTKPSKTAYGVTFTVNADGSVKVVGTSTAQVTFALDTITLPAGEYHLSGCPTGLNNNALIYFPGTSITGDYGTGRTFTLSEEAALTPTILVRNGTTINATFYPQIEAGSTATEYEPYTGGKPSPSPDYPQEITSVDGAAVEFHGANMWGGSKMAEDFNVLKAVIYGSNEHGDYIEFEQGGGLPNKVRFYPCPFKDDTQYTIVLAFENTRGNRYTTIIVGYSDGTYTEIAGPNTDGSYAQFVFVTAANKTVDHLRGVLRTVNNRYYYNQCGIFEGVHTVDDFQPYSSATASLLPDGYSLRSLPDGTKDELHLSYLRPSKREGWAWYSRELVKRVGKFIATSPNGWTKSKFASNGYYNSVGQITDGLGKPNAKNSIMSPWFKAPNSLGEYFQTVNSCWVDSAVNFNIDPDVFSGTALEFGAWVAEHNIEYYMPLATPTTETLDPIELPIMPSQTVNVWSDPATNLKMTYIQDSNLIIENLEATIADIATT